MQLRWVVLRTIKKPDKMAVTRGAFESSPSVCVVGTVDAEDRAEACARAFHIYGPHLEVTSEISFRLQRSEETRLKRRNRTRFVDLMDTGLVRRGGRGRA